MSKPKPYDVVVYGATGYTGRLVAEYLVQNYGETSGLTWAMAGRSHDKLVGVRNEIGAPAQTPLIVADAADEASLSNLTGQAKVVLTTVGPYQLYGSPLVAACARSGTDYVDLCGEPAWMRQMIDQYAAQAQVSGARIVFSCGFDSIPFDLGVLFCQEEARKQFGAFAPRVKGRVRKMKGTFSGGTAASLKATVEAAMKDPAIVALLRDPFSLVPGFTGPAQPAGTKPEFDHGLGVWLAPFVMAPINTRNVHRTNALLGHLYGPEFVYDEMLVTGPGENGERMAQAVAKDRSLTSGDGPKPGEGPSRAERESGHYDVLFVGEVRPGAEIRVSVTGDRDPGYGSTSKMIAEAAVCLLQEARGTKGGIWTPGAALGLPLIGRLEARAGLKFRLESGPQ